MPRSPPSRFILRSERLRLASEEFLSAATGVVNAGQTRGCGPADMEAGGAARAYRHLLSGTAAEFPPKLLVLRCISYRGDEQKGEIEKAIGPNVFRRACMRTLARFLHHVMV